MGRTEDSTDTLSYDWDITNPVVQSFCSDKQLAKNVTLLGFVVGLSGCTVRIRPRNTTAGFKIMPTYERSGGIKGFFRSRTSKRAWGEEAGKEAKLSCRLWARKPLGSMVRLLPILSVLLWMIGPSSPTSYLRYVWSCYSGQKAPSLKMFVCFVCSVCFCFCCFVRVDFRSCADWFGITFLCAPLFCGLKLW